MKLRRIPVLWILIRLSCPLGAKLISTVQLILKKLKSWSLRNLWNVKVLLAVQWLFQHVTPKDQHSGNLGHRLVPMTEACLQCWVLLRFPWLEGPWNISYQYSFSYFMLQLLLLFIFSSAFSNSAATENRLNRLPIMTSMTGIEPG